MVKSEVLAVVQAFDKQILTQVALLERNIRTHQDNYRWSEEVEAWKKEKDALEAIVKGIEQYYTAVE